VGVDAVKDGESEQGAMAADLGALSDMQTMLLPMGSGMELSIKWSPANRKL
jgi:hypothetical protein